MLIIQKINYHGFLLWFSKEELKQIGHVIWGKGILMTVLKDQWKVKGGGKEEIKKNELWCLKIRYKIAGAYGPGN